jgi:dephospho-CoA kinase
MLKVALTGGIATGKSYVAARFRDAGVPVVDSDVLAREAVAPGTEGLAAVVERFGPGVLSVEGALDRARLADIVFRDAAARRDLEAIVHPYVRRRIAEFFDGLPPGTPWAVADIPLLFETGRQKEFDLVVVAACTRDRQLERLVRRDRLTREAAEQRLAAQLPIEEKVRRADFVIRTDGAYDETNAQVAQLLAQLDLLAAQKAQDERGRERPSKDSQTR